MTRCLLRPTSWGLESRTALLTRRRRRAALPVAALLSTMARGEEGMPVARRISQHRYHRDATSDAAHQFDAVETTMSHLFRFPHPALGGLSFGAALADRLLELELPAGPRVVEVGGGTGAMAEAVLTRLRERIGARTPELSYTIVDLAPRLQEAQVQRLRDAPEIAFVTGDAQRLPLRDGAVDGLLLSNEVIADLDVVAFDPDGAQGDEPLEQLCHRLVQRYGLELPAGPAEALLNVGAIHMIEEVARVLAPGAGAFISEFGGLDPVKGVELADVEGDFTHTEFTIHFGHLLRVAEAHGLTAQLEPMISFLRMPADMRVTNYNDVGRARIVLPELEVAAWPENEFRARVKSLADYFPITLPELGGAGFPDDVSKPFAESFHCLLLRRPGPSRAD